jgi:uncharacterized protein YndB with AHSA1/START domain
MATDSIHVSALIPASPQAVYDAWLSSEGHAKMTGAAASIEPHVGGKHCAWDGYISGETLELEPGKRIVQTWRASDFPDGAGHSQIVVKLEEEDGKTRLLIDHTDIPDGHGERFQSGWLEYYVNPMIAHFGGAAEKPAEAAPAKKPARKPAAKKSAKKAAAKKGAAKKGAAKKTAKKAAAKKTAKKGAAKKAAAKKPAAKKSAKKAAAKKPAAKKAKKPAAKKAKKPAARKPKAAPTAAAPAEAAATPAE